MKVIGKINFKAILFFGLIEILVTIFLCYILAVTLKHKPAWLPTISECGELPPEKYFFRWGILVGGILLILEAVVLYCADYASLLVSVLGSIAGLGLTGVACVASNENRTVHLVFALSFFVLEDIMVLLLLLCSHKSMSYRSLAMKIPSTIVACAATTLRFLIVFDVIRLSGDIPIIPIIEWINTFALIFYHLSLSDELSHLYLAALEDETPKSQKQSQNPSSSVTPLPVKTPLL